MISTATAAVNANPGPDPVPSQNPSVATDRAITIGTKMPLIRSASRCARALPVCASSTSRAIWASWVSAPTRVTRTTRWPSVLMVPPVTGSPGTTSTGTDSPVIMEVSTAPCPVSIVPSVAIFSPGRTTNRIPTARSSMLIRSSTGVPPWSRSTDTSRAPSASRARRAAPALRLDRASK